MRQGVSTNVYFPGSSIRGDVGELIHLDDGVVPGDGATVTFTLYDAEGELVEQEAGVATDGRWLVDLSLPSTPGTYVLVARAVLDDGVTTWVGRAQVVVAALV